MKTKMGKTQYVIVSFDHRDSDDGMPLYWCNTQGWVDHSSADRFTLYEAKRAQMIGQWGILPEDGDFTEFFDNYVITALWSSNDNADDNGGHPLDANYDVDDIEAETRRQMITDCLSFLCANLQYILPSRYKEAGGDFWLTRNRHGAGFWDGQWEKDAAKALTDAAHNAGGYDLYVSEEGKLYGN
jgi:hypothetical protein